MEIARDFKEMCVLRLHNPCNKARLWANYLELSSK